MKPRGVLADGLETVKLVTGDVDRVALPHLVGLAAEGDAGAAGDDHDAIVVRMAFTRRAAAGRNVVVADPVLGARSARRSVGASERRRVMGRDSPGAGPPASAEAGQWVPLRGGG